MRLNFWQWIGVALLVVGVIVMFTRKTADDRPGGPGAPGGTAPATQQAQ